MIRDASPHDLNALGALFARANDAPYDLAAVAEEKCFGHGIAGAPAVRAFEREGRIIGAAVRCGRFVRILIVDRDARGQGIGTALLADAEARGASVVAAEAGNYFTPGVLDGAFFSHRGYVETRSTWNLHVELASLSLVESPLVRRVRHDESDRVLDFIEREFGKIWRFEAAKAFQSAVVQAFIAETEGAVTGFAVHDVNNRGLGFFGPAGVAETMRGRGLGCALVQASLADLRRLGYSRAVIPWTDAIDFYRKCCGAEPAHRFVTMSRHGQFHSAVLAIDSGA